MKVKYIGKASDPLYFIEGHVYDKVGESKKSGMWRVVDETGEDFLYPAGLFEPVDEEEK